MRGFGQLRIMDYEQMPDTLCLHSLERCADRVDFLHVVGINKGLAEMRGHRAALFRVRGMKHKVENGILLWESMYPQGSESDLLPYQW